MQVRFRNTQAHFQNEIALVELLSFLPVGGYDLSKVNGDIYCQPNYPIDPHGTGISG